MSALRENSCAIVVASKPNDFHVFIKAEID